MTTTDKIFEVRDRASDAILSQQEERILKKYKGALEKVRLLIAGLYERFPSEEGGLDLSSSQISTIRKQIERIIDEASKEERRVVAFGIKQTYKQNYYFTTDAIRLATLGLIALGPVGTAIVKAALVNSRDPKGWKARSSINSQDAASKATSAIKAAVKRKYLISQASKAVKKIIEAQASKAVRILSTEMHRAETEGAIMAIERAGAKGVKFKRIWNPRDPRFPRDHQSMKGQIANAQGYFSYPSGNTSEGPGMSGDPGDDCNCRCSLIFKKI